MLIRCFYKVTFSQLLDNIGSDILQIRVQLGIGTKTMVKKKTTKKLNGHTVREIYVDMAVQGDKLKLSEISRYDSVACEVCEYATRFRRS